MDEAYLQSYAPRNSKGANLNKGNNEKLKSTCNTLQEYTEFTERVRENRKTMSLENAVGKTIDECIIDGILKEFLIQHKAEVYNMCLYEFDEELHEETLREEGRMEERERMKKIVKEFMNGSEPEEIAKKLNIPLEDIKELLD